MMRRGTTLALAAALYVAAVATAHGAPHRTPTAFAVSVGRPFVLPSLWRQLAEASRRGDPAEAIAAGRTIARLLPGWTDGLVHVAWIAGLDLSREAASADEKVDLLTTAAAWLEQAALDRRDRDPSAAAELLGAAATLVEARATHDPELGAEFRRRTLQDPSAVANALIERALEIAPDPTLRERLAFSTARLAAGAVRMGDLPRAEITLRTAIDQLAALDRPEARATAAALAALRPLGAYLRDADARRALLDDPRVADLGHALTDLADGRH